jgi:hypothetical protein
MSLNIRGLAFRFEHLEDNQVGYKAATGTREKRFLSTEYCSPLTRLIFLSIASYITRSELFA